MGEKSFHFMSFDQNLAMKALLVFLFIFCLQSHAFRLTDIGPKPGENDQDAEKLVFTTLFESIKNFFSNNQVKGI